MKKSCPQKALNDDRAHAGELALLFGNILEHVCYKGLKKVPLNGPQLRGKGLCWDYEYGMCPHDDEGTGCAYLHGVKGSAVIRCMHDEQGQYCPSLQLCLYEHHHVRNTNRLPWVWVVDQQAVWVGDSQ